MRTYLVLFFLTLLISTALAQDPGLQAAQQAQQIAIQQTQMAAQAAQQAMDQATIAAQQAQLANQQAMQNAQQAQISQGYRCVAATPRFSVESGNYSAPLTVKIKDSSRGTVIYYTTDGWTPTGVSTRYVGPLTLYSTTTVQAIAIPPCGGRSRVATAIYTLDGEPPSPPPASSSSEPAVPMPAPDEKLLLARGTPVPLVFAAEVSSKTTEVGDKIPLTLADDLKSGNVIVAKKGTPATATITGVDKPGLGGLPGELFFEVDSLDAGGVAIKLRGGEAKEGQDKIDKAIGLMFIPGVPVGVFVHGKDAEIKAGATFTAFVDADALLASAK